MYRFAAACALVIVSALAAEAEVDADQYRSSPYQQQQQYAAPQPQGYGQQPQGYGQPQQSYGAPPVHQNGFIGGRGAPHAQSYQAPQQHAPQSYGHQSRAQSKAPSGLKWEVRSTQRPRDVVAFNAAPVDPYWKYQGKSDKEVVASCTFDFLGYSHSQGSVELIQKPHDLTSIIGEFEGLKPGLHAMKIHEFGDLEHGCESIGDVFNPFGAHHGHSHDDIHKRRVGDIEQIQARFDSNAEYKNRDLLVNLSGPNSVVGKAMAIYEREDDHGQTEHQNTADGKGRFREGEGKKIACCIIGLSEKAKKVDDKADAMKHLFHQ